MKRLFVLVLLIVISSGCVIKKQGMKGDYLYYSTMSPDIVFEVSPDYKYAKGSQGYMDHEYTNLEKRTRIYMNHEKLMILENKVDYFYPTEKWIFTKFENEIILRKGKYKRLGQVWHYKDTLLPNNGKYNVLIRDIGHFTELHDIFTIRYQVLLTKSELFLINKEFEKGNFESVDLIIRRVESDIKFYKYTTSNIKLD